MKRMGLAVVACMGISFSAGFLTWLFRNGGKDGIDHWEHLSFSLAVTAFIFWGLCPIACVLSYEPKSEQTGERSS